MNQNMHQAYVRQATEADAPAIARLRRSWTDEQVGTPVADDAFEAMFAGWFERERSRRITWLAEVAGEPVGMLNLVVFDRMPRPIAPGHEDRPTQWGYIANVYVEESARNAGAGRLLGEAALAYADEHRFARVVLSPTERSRSFYERLGFGPATELMVHRGAGR